MKNLIIALALFPILSFAQIGKQKFNLSDGVQDSVLGTSLILKDNAVIFQKVYASDLNKGDLINQLKNFLPTVKSFSIINQENQTLDQFSGKLVDYVVNYKKYGGDGLGSGMLLAYPLSANVIIQVKENRYRVTISNVLFKGINVGLNGAKMDYELSELSTRSKRSAISNSERILRALNYISKDFEEAFNSSKKQVDTNF